MKTFDDKSGRFPAAIYSLFILVLAMLLASCNDSGPAASSSPAPTSEGDNCTEALPAEKEDDGDCLVYLYATDTSAHPLDLVPDTDFNFSDWDTGANFDGNYTQDSDYSKVFEVAGSGDPASWGTAFALTGFGSAFASVYNDLLFKIKGVSSITIALAGDGVPNVETQVDLSSADIDGTTGWKRVTFPFPSDDQNASSYNAFAIFTTNSADTFYLTDIAFRGLADTGSGSSNEVDVALPVTFEEPNATYSFTDFDGGSAAVIANPDANGINTSGMVGQMIKDGGQPWGGSTLELDTSIDFADGEVFTIKVWSARAVPVLMQLEGQSLTGGNGNAPNVTAQHSGGSEWQELTFDFSAAAIPVGNFATSGDAATKITLIFDNGVLGDHTNNPNDWQFYFDDIVQGMGGSSSTIVELPVDFESASLTYNFNDFDGGSAAVIANPDANGINTSGMVGQMIKDGGQVWGGSTLELDTSIDFADGEVFTMKVWSARAVPVLMQLEGQSLTGGNGNAPNVTAQHSGGSEWQELTFDFSAAAIPVGNFATSGDAATKITLIFDNGVLGDHTNNPNDWQFYFDDIVQKSGGDSTATEPTTAAPAPTAAASDVISVFSDAYTNISGVDTNPNWGQATVTTTETIAGGSVLKLAGLDYQGINFDTNAQDVSSMTHLHLDYWTADATALDVFLISTGPVETPSAVTVTRGSWQSIDIPLSDYSSAVDLTDVIQFKFVGNGTVYLDNIYFHSSGGSTPATAAPTPPTRVASNVISLFSDAYADIAVDAWSASWDDSDIVDDMVAGDAVKVITFTNFLGVDFNTNRQDLSSFTHMHIDFWVGETDLVGKVFNLKLSDWAGGSAENSALEFNINTATTPAIVSGSWISADIPLSSFSNPASRSDVAQFVITSNLSTVYADNIYFYK